MDTGMHTASVLGQRDGISWERTSKLTKRLWNTLENFWRGARMSRIILFYNDEKLTLENQQKILKSIKSKHAHTLGWIRPEETTGKCSKNHGYYCGHGVCLLQSVIKRQQGCAKCKSNEILAQLNWVFQNTARYAGFRAEWKPEKKKTKRSKKRVDK
jgi:hypothetical protein